MNLKSRNLIHEAMNLDSGKKAVTFVRDIFVTTLIIELLGALLSLIVFAQDYDLPKAIGISLFHSVASFNNSGFDILGGFKNLQNYNDNVLLNLVTSGLIFFGGIGFLVIKEIITKKFNWKKFSMHTKVVLSVSIVLIIAGMLLIKLTTETTWLEAFFHSVSSRTAGFSTRNLAEYSTPALLVICALMFVGASPGSTGGGIKTSTLFVLSCGIKSSATNKAEHAFNYSLPKDAYKKASVITLLALFVVLISTFLMTIFESANTNMRFVDILFECTSAFGTVGLSTGITPHLTVASKILSIVVMFIGRLGPLTIASMWTFSRRETLSYPEGNIAIG